MDRFLALAQAAEPGDPEIEGSALAGAHGMLALLDDDKPGALEGLRRGVAILDTLPQQGPAPYRAVWPLLLAANGDADAAAAIGSARRIGLSVNRVNRGILGYADAILAGRAGDQHQAKRSRHGCISPPAPWKSTSKASSARPLPGPGPS